MWTRAQRLWERLGKGKRKSDSEDLVELWLPFTRICLKRKSALPVPHELQVVIPRVEIRDITVREERSIRHQREIVLSSVTVVSAPRREQSPGGNA